MKKYKLLLIVPFLFGFTVLVSDLYTQKQIEKIITRIVKYNVSFYKTTDSTLTQKSNLLIKPITLSEFLRINKRVLSGPRGYWACCNHDNWKKLMISNSELISSSFKKYAKMGLKQINSQIKDSKWVGAKDLSFSAKKFWSAHKYVFDKYIFTINELLKLNEDDLNYFIFTNNPDNKASSYELYEWAVSKRIISEGVNHNKWNNTTVLKKLDETQKPVWLTITEGVWLAEYQMPADLLLLMKRICEKNPTITPRDFLLQGRQRVLELEEIIKELGYW